MSTLHVERTKAVQRLSGDGVWTGVRLFCYESISLQCLNPTLTGHIWKSLHKCESGFMIMKFFFFFRPIRGNWWRTLDTRMPVQSLIYRFPPLSANSFLLIVKGLRFSLFSDPPLLNVNKRRGSMGIQCDSFEQKVGNISIDVVQDLQAKHN